MLNTMQKNRTSLRGLDQETLFFDLPLNNLASCCMNNSVLIKTKMVLIGTDILLLVHATACADFDNKFERKT